MRLRLQNLQRIHKQFIMLFVDIFTLLLALWLAFVLRLGDPFPLDYIISSWWIFFTLPLITIFLFIKLGLYRAVLQYIGIKIIREIQIIRGDTKSQPSKLFLFTKINQHL